MKFCLNNELVDGTEAATFGRFIQRLLKVEELTRLHPITEQTPDLTFRENKNRFVDIKGIAPGRIVSLGPTPGGTGGRI